jgi:lipoprotein-releasing system permease protein
MAVMIVSVAVALGFKHEVRHKVTGLTADLLMTHFDDQKSFETESIAMPDSLVKAVEVTQGVAHVQRYSTKPGMILTDQNFQGMVLKGLAQEYNLDYLNEHLEEGSLPAFSDSVATHEALVSRTMAQKLHLQLDDALYTYYINGEDVRARRFKVVGIYNTQFTAFDELFVITDLCTVNRLNAWQDDEVSGVEIALQSKADTEAVREALIHRFATVPGRYYLRTVEEANPQIFSWLELLDMNVWVILILMAGVAGFTMISGLLIIILEHTHTIGVLKAMGADNSSVRRIFLYFAMLVIGKGMLIGNAVGLALCLVQGRWHVMPLDPATYYVAYVPMEWQTGWWLVLNVAVALVSVGMLIGPSFIISHIHPARTIRWE